MLPKCYPRFSEDCNPAGQRQISSFDFSELGGAQSRNRTSDTRIFNPLLYQLSYLGPCRKPEGLPERGVF